MKKKNGEATTATRRIGVFSYRLSVFLSSFSCLRAGVLLLFLAAAAVAQELPDEIRGYKVHKAKISVSSRNEKIDKKEKSEAFVRVGEPILVDTSLTGLTFEVTAEVDDLEQSGKVDFLMFKDFKVNGLNVEIEEYTESFEFKKNRLLNLPRPVKIFLGSREALRGAFGEFKESKTEWTVTGRIFVFGRFKKFGFDFKRVVPVDVAVKIKNPLKTENLPTGAVRSF